MKHTLALGFTALLFSSAPALAQTPIYFPLPAGYYPTDVSTAGGNVTVVGRSFNSGGAFKWTPAGGIVEIGSTTHTSAGTVRISRDGTKIVGIQNVGGINNVAIDNGTATWTTVPGIGGTSGSSSTSLGGVNADGTTIVGLGWAVGGAGHAFKWTPGGGSVDLMPFFNSPSSNARGVSGNGNVIVGHESSQGARWVGGVRTFFTYSGQGCNSAWAVNNAGTIAIGELPLAAPGNAWRWDSGTNLVSLLPNLVGSTTNPNTIDLTDDGSLILGSSGSVPFGPPAVSMIWVNNVPQDLVSYLGGLGMGPGNVEGPAAISPEGGAIVGTGSTGGWAVIFPQFLPNGTPFCAGDGSGTACPCANASTPGANEGCLNSLAIGGKLRGSGAASLAADSLAMTSTQVPNGPALYFQGDGQYAAGAGIVFGDGLLCAGGTIIRLGVKFAAGNTSTYPGAGDPQLSVQGGVSAGDVRNYQAWYRDAAAFCTPSFFNLTNGVTINWTN